LTSDIAILSVISSTSERGGIAPPQHALNSFGEIEIGQQFGGNVHRHGRIGIGSQQAARRLDRLLEYRRGQSPDLPVLLGQRDELRGRHVAEDGAGPARKRLAPDHPGRRECNFWLENGKDLEAVQPVA
jgi:hypothetical protein